MISIVIPVYNEVGNIQKLHQELLEVLKNLNQKFEIIFINDGSIDGTLQELKKLKPVRIISFKRNYGKSAAFDAGFKKAAGDIIVTMDGDLQNDPHDIPRLLDGITEGYDVVAGWRIDRWKNNKITRRIPSKIANWLISKITGVRLHDHGCALKAYKKLALADIELHEDMQRMVQVHAVRNGARIKEVVVRFRERTFGTPKFGASRFITVLLDLLNFYFFDKFERRSSHFFGAIGILILLLGFLTFLWSLLLRIIVGTHFSRTPLPVFTALFVVVGFQFIFMGVLAELIVRNQQKISKVSTYTIQEEFEEK